jgi:hypothetical protein
MAGAEFPPAQFEPPRRRPMSRPKPTEIIWLEDVDEHYFAAAESYLGLIYPAGRVAELIAGLRTAPIVPFKAKDIFRASGLSLLGVSNSHVDKDIQKIQQGLGLTPILLVRDEPNGKVVIADGYHRMCAIYTFNEDEWIKAKIT